MDKCFKYRKSGCTALQEDFCGQLSLTLILVSHSITYGVLLTWRVTLYECVLSVSQATGQRASNRVGVECC